MVSENVFASRPWLDAYPDGVPHDIDEVTETLPEMLASSVARFGRHTALDFFGATTSYRELGDAVSRVANGLRKLGVTPGDRVAIALPNCPQHVIALYAVLRIGAIAVEHNPLYTSRELRHQFEDHGAKVALVWDSLADTIADFPSDVRPDTIVAVDVTRAMPTQLRVALRLPIPRVKAQRERLTSRPRSRNLRTWESLASARRLPHRVAGPSLDDIALLQYTSGTTGTPKGAMLSHRNLRSNAEQGRAWVPELREGKETFAGMLPLFHAYGLTLCATCALSLGARLVLFPSPDVDLVIRSAKKVPPTFLPAVPPLYDRLARASQDGRIDLRSVRFAISGAMSLPLSTITQWETESGGVLVEGYGMTEASPIAIGNPMGQTRRPGTVGVPFPSTEIRVVDPEDTSKDVGPDAMGELLIRGPQVFTGYWRRPDETNASFVDGGWLRTGDLVTVSADGFVTVVDRLKELIITGGFNVSPSEVEEVLVAHPDIVDAATVAIPHPSTGAESVAAAVVLAESAVGDPEAIRDFCRSRLAAYKVPRRIDIVDELPRSLIGKVLRREVRDQMVARVAE